MQDLVRSFRSGETQPCSAASQDMFSFLGLENTSRPSLLTHEWEKNSRILSSLGRMRNKKLSESMPSRELGIKIEDKNESDDRWATSTQLKPLNDACTKWCTATYFPTAQHRINIVINVILVFEAVTRLLPPDFPSFHIVFKGGVMIRLLLREFVSMQSVRASVALSRYMKEHRAFSMSDFDFEIVPDDHNLSPSQTHKMSYLNFSCLSWIEGILESELEKRKSDTMNLEWEESEKLEELKVTLQECVDGEDIAHDSPLKGSRIDAVTFPGAPGPKGYATRSGKAFASPRQDVLIFDCEGSKCISPSAEFLQKLGWDSVCRPRKRTNKLYATLNTYIGKDAKKERDDHLRSMFHLSRIKHGFVVYYRTKSGEQRIDRLGGEIIDLSQSHGTHSDETRSWIYDQMTRDAYRDYPILGVKRMDLRSYTPQGFFYDHHAMIFHSENIPWKANKIEKRLLRYACFLVMHVLSADVKGRREDKLSSLLRLVENTSSVKAIQMKRKFSVPEIQLVAETLRRTVGKAGYGHLRASSMFLKMLHTHLSKLVTACESPSGEWTSNVVSEAALWHSDHTIQHTLGK